MKDSAVIERYLKRYTQHEWEEISPLYLRYKTQFNPFGQFCVFTPDNFISHPESARFFIPSECDALHNPDEFLKNYLNVQKQLVKSVPWVSVDLGSLPPKLYEFMTGEGLYVVGKFQFKGKVSIRPINSKFNFDVNFNNLQYVSIETRQKVFKFLKNDISMNISMSSSSMQIGLETENEQWSTKISLDGNQIKAEISLPVLHLLKDGLEMFIKMEIEFSGLNSGKPQD